MLPSSNLLFTIYCLIFYYFTPKSARGTFCLCKCLSFARSNSPPSEGSGVVIPSGLCTLLFTLYFSLSNFLTKKGLYLQILNLHRNLFQKPCCFSAIQGSMVVGQAESNMRNKSIHTIS